MVSRRAECGHDYEYHRVAAFERQASARVMFNRRAVHAANERWGRQKGDPRRAVCGHPVPYHPGPARRSCDECSPRRAAMACAHCGAELLGRRADAKYCSTEHGEIHRGERLAEPYPDRVCMLDECGAAFTPKSSQQRCCSQAHGKTYDRQVRRLCGVDRNVEWTDARRDNYHRRRARRKGATTGDPVRFVEIANRDGWMCRLCDQPVDSGREWPDPMSPSLDHVVPLSKGGAHDPSNVQLAHLVCNSAKGNRQIA